MKNSTKIANAEGRILQSVCSCISLSVSWLPEQLGGRPDASFPLLLMDKGSSSRGSEQFACMRPSGPLCNLHALHRTAGQIQTRHFSFAPSPVTVGECGQG